MRFSLKFVALIAGCATVAFECLTGHGPVTATAVLTVAGTVAL